ncbi:unnamed protein product [Larinioides sclopetarius]|uniref:MATH domain-containing protein n=1 Tax=Larinioides sclopetarius TaxID=280406 RepID=A0AAV1Z5K1_9ARAC
MDWYLWMLLGAVSFLFLPDDSKQEAGDNLHLAQIKELPSGVLIAEYDWLIQDVVLLLQAAHSPRGHAYDGPVFLTSRPGYKLRLRLTAGHTNPADGLNYIGLWFSVVPGPYDEALQWPFPYGVNMTIVSRKEGFHSVHAALERCRTRPGLLEGEGCGTPFLIPHEHVLDEPFLVNGALLVRATVFLEEKSLIPKRTRIFMKANRLVSEFIWQVDDLPSPGLPVISPPFQLDNEGYLLQLQLPFSSEGVGLFAAILPSAHDSSLAWPFALPFELALLDRKGTVDPTAGGTCPQAAFRKPHANRTNPPCGFRRMGTLKALQARALNGTGVVARFTAVLDQVPQIAGLAFRDQYLVSEYTWRVPHIERKLQLAKAGRLSNLLSERFFSTQQGYLMQLQIKFQNHTMGLYLTLLEGANDPSLQWPFDKRFSLLVLDQREAGAEHMGVSVDPTDPQVGQEACPGSFWRPFGRNDACGSAHVLTYDQLYDKKFIRYGAILLKVVIYLDEVRPPRFASLIFQENHLSARYEWFVPDLLDKIRRAREGRLAFLDSEKFYLSNNGYRMMLRLYPEKGPGFLGLYAVLTRGVYDSELRWPFPHSYSLEVIMEGRPPLRRTTHPGSGCPDIAFQRPDRELSEWSCGEGHMIAHETLLGLPEEKWNRPLAEREEKISVVSNPNSLVPHSFTEKAIEMDLDEVPSVQPEQPVNEKKKSIGVRFAITVFLQELLPPVASLRLENGVLVAKYSWVLPDATASIGLLQSREKNRLESSVFYSENQGYAMRLALSLSRRNSLPNGEQVVGLFWTLQTGQHDYALQWPFSSIVTLSLVGRIASLQRVIVPGSSKCPMEAFDRSQGPNNEHSCGFASLLTLSELFSNYVHNNMLHIKVTITLN